MSLNSHLSELERRHAALEKELKTAAQHMSLDNLELRELKRQKLMIRDEISRLKKSVDGQSIH